LRLLPRFRSRAFGVGPSIARYPYFAWARYQPAHKADE